MAIIPSYYGGLATSQAIQFILDQSQRELDAQSIWRQYLDLAPASMSLTFDSVIGRDRIAAAASIVDVDAPAPLRSRNKLERYTGKIPAIKEKFRMQQEDMRNIEIIRLLQTTGSVNVGGSIVEFLTKDLAEAAVSGDKRQDLMFLQALSTFQIPVNITNNPDGAVFGTVDLLAQSYQSQGVPVIWSDAANAKPVTDIERWLQWQAQTKGRLFGRIMMSNELWYAFKATAEVKSMLATFFNVGKASATFAVTPNNINEFFTANGWPPIEIVNYTTNIEVDGVATFVKGFDVNACVFAPAGKLGVLHNAIPMERLHAVPGKSYASYGPTLVGKWCEQEPLVEFTGMEMLAFPGVNIDGIFKLTTNVVAAYSAWT